MSYESRVIQLTTDESMYQCFNGCIQHATLEESQLLPLVIAIDAYSCAMDIDRQVSRTTLRLFAL